MTEQTDFTRDEAVAEILTEVRNFHSVETLCNEGNRFVQKHQLEGAAASLGALTWGLLRALYECPNCPGQFRESRMSTIGIEVLWCPRCGGQWIHKDDLAELEAPTRPEQPALWEAT